MNNVAPANLFRNRVVPDVLEALICDDLDSQSLHAMKLTSKGTKLFVRDKHRRLSVLRDPNHLGVQRAEEKLTPLEKLELQFIKFNDRPVWQRVAIVFGLIL